MLKATGILLLVGLIFIFFSTAYLNVTYLTSPYFELESIHIDVLFLSIYAYISIFAGIYFVIKTKLGKSGDVLDDLRRENEIIQMKIENKRLTEELDQM